MFHGRTHGTSARTSEHLHYMLVANCECLPLNNQPTSFVETHGKQVMHLDHPQEEFAKNLRGYISTVVSALTC